jgi:hypothetical protein
MKMNLFKIAIFTLFSTVLLAFTGCLSTPEVDKQVTNNFKEGVPGGTMVETYEMSAKVIAVNAATRQLTFTGPDGSTNTFYAGPSFKQFETYRVGDEVKVAMARELSMYLGHEIPTTVADPAAIVSAKPGVQPGVLTAATVQITGTVVAVNISRQEATLHLSDGRTITFKIRKDIDLTQVKLGAEVVIRTAAAMAVLPEKP